ncbi:hypothetical protein FOCC_FOCC011469 [Frankliniella occidentalis]|nr:hypothetical protein FOCC_FOCC011469 [Frankliniella occidentalis]
MPQHGVLPALLVPPGGRLLQPLLSPAVGLARPRRRRRGAAQVAGAQPCARQVRHGQQQGAEQAGRRPGRAQRSDARSHPCAAAAPRLDLHGVQRVRAGTRHAVHGAVLSVRGQTALQLERHGQGARRRVLPGHPGGRFAALHCAVLPRGLGLEHLVGAHRPPPGQEVQAHSAGRARRRHQAGRHRRPCRRGRGEGAEAGRRPRGQAPLRAAGGGPGPAQT